VLLNFILARPLPGSWPTAFAQPPIIPLASTNSLATSSTKNHSMKVLSPDHLAIESVSELEDGESELSSLDPLPEEPVDHHIDLESYAASSSGSSFGVGKLPSLESEFDESAHPTLSTHPNIIIPPPLVKGNRVVIPQRAEAETDRLPPPVLLRPHSQAVQLNVATGQSAQRIASRAPSPSQPQYRTASFS
jgi:hypothetical protein